MALDPAIRARLTLPAVCAPMFLVSGPALVREACKAGLIGAIPRQNARSLEEFDGWLGEIRRDLDAFAAARPGARIGPLAVNLPTRLADDELARSLAVCRRHGVDLIISAAGDPTELIARVHDIGGQVFHDVVNLRFAEKAIAAGADGLTCIGAGGGGHAGAISHLTLIPKVRAIFDGTILMAGAIGNGAAIRAAEVLGADLAYLGTRFIATREAAVDAAYKDLLVAESSRGLRYTDAVGGAPASWILQSLRRVGLDPDNLPPPGRPFTYDHLPENARPWRDFWSAGQAIDLIDDVPSVADLCGRLRREYVAACATPDMAEVARLADAALEAAD
ncbi:nitronate monooxygenase [Phenylobacterium sp. LjRoot219]|uniref:NAD(P)H-dependent flavin oxidoreductase n=1 Tax=Phenylobacterium sp. LjRoot219 TaxID=3342283 RepID=UPI003ECE76FA